MIDKTNNTDKKTRKKPKVSVIIPAFNAGKYLPKCLDSVLNQTFKNFEVIIVNDGSTDNTMKICEHYAAEHNNITVINQNNQGLSHARNTGLNVCKGDYIAFTDADDYVEKNWLKSFIDTLVEYTLCDMVVQGLIINYKNHEEKVFLPQAFYEGKDIIRAYNILKSKSIDGFMHNKIYKKSIIEKHHLRFELKLKEDLLFNFRYLTHISALAIIPSCCYHYIQHDSQSLIHQRYSADFMRILITSLRNSALVLADKYDDEAFSNFVIEDYMLAYSVLLFSMYRKANGIDKKNERIKYIKEYQQIRKTNCNIRIRKGSKAKRFFAMFMMLPPTITDFVMSITKSIYK